MSENPRENERVGREAVLVHTDVRDFLRAWLDIKPHSYGFLSLRSGLSKSHLANLLSGRRRITQDTAERIAEGLQLSEPETAWFLALAASTDGRTERLREEARQSLPELLSRLRPDTLHQAWTPAPADRTVVSMAPEEMASLMAELRALQLRIQRAANQTPRAGHVIRAVRVGIADARE